MKKAFNAIMKLGEGVEIYFLIVLAVISLIK